MKTLLCLLLGCFSLVCWGQSSNSSDERIISLAPHITELVFAVGAGDELVGAVSYSDYPVAAREIPRIGGYETINFEAIIALNPTLVIGWDSGNGSDMLERLRALGLNVHSHNPDTLEDVGESLRWVGNLSGHAQEGNQAAEAFLLRLKQLRTGFSGRSPVRLYYQLWNEPQMTVNDEHLISDVIRLCGGANIFADAMPLIPKVSIESVIQRNPQAIVLAGMSGNQPEWLEAWRHWTSIEAVKKDNLFEIHPDLLHRHSPRILDGTAELCSALDVARSRLSGE